MATSDIVKNIFKELNDSEVAFFIQSSRQQSYPANYKVCTEDALEEVFYVILDGEVTILKQLNESGPKTHLETKITGDCFGEMALLTGNPRSADVITTQPSTFLELDLKSFLEMVRLNANFMLHMRQLTSRYKLNHSRTRQTQNVHKVDLKSVFISHSRRNSDDVLLLIADLQKQIEESNISLWLDQTHIPAGERWDKAIEKALEDAAAMLLVLTEDAIKSENVNNEIAYCLDEKKPIIPVMKEACKLPLRLRSVNYIDFVNQPYEKALARTIEALKKI